MTYPEMPSIGICLSWRPGSSGGDRECCRIGVVLNDILLMNLFNIEDGLGGVFSLNSEVNVVPTIFCLSELPMRYYVGVKSRNECNVSQ
jgi:hypothetical protein